MILGVVTPTSDHTIDRQSLATITGLSNFGQILCENEKHMPTTVT